MLNNHIYLKQDHGYLKGYIIDESDELFLIDDAMVAVSDFDESFLNMFLTVIEQNFKTVSYISSLFVEEKHRSGGVGAELLDQFEKLSNSCEIRFVLARVSNPQRPGFNLLAFYMKRGYRPIKLSDGDFLMVNKENYEFINSILCNEYEVALSTEIINSYEESVRLKESRKNRSFFFNRDVTSQPVSGFFAPSEACLVK